jgi:malate synthase
VRGAKVIAFARNFLDQAAPWPPARTRIPPATPSKAASWSSLKDGSKTGLKDEAKFIGYQGDARAQLGAAEEQRHPHRHHQPHPIGSTDAAGVADVVVEAALSTILDLEDSVAAVDAEDKVNGYANWLGILKGTLTESLKRAARP